MNGMSNQQGFQNFQSNNQQANQYQPAGFVQSHYQGNIPTQNAGPVTSHLGYQANNQHQQSFQPQSFQSNMNSGFAGSQHQSQPVISHLGLSSQAQSQQPVLSHVGLQAGQHQYGQGSHYQPQSQQAHYQPAQFQSNSYQQQQHQPVISHAGFQAGAESQSPVLQHAQVAGSGQQHAGFQSNQAFQSHQGFQQAQAHTPQNPVYQASHAQQNQGPVISHLGYQAGSHGQYQQGMNNRF
ncbi:hypothetical protein [Paenibacillus sp. 1P07SE]|uniref:hypothetical protein n=1 Tax=Paenibacillus sp. 1P07SE TaxID=3132209 RepID=UPI0039A7687D